MSSTSYLSFSAVRDAMIIFLCWRSPNPSQLIYLHSAQSYPSMRYSRIIKEFVACYSTSHKSMSESSQEVVWAMLAQQPKIRVRSHFVTDNSRIPRTWQWGQHNIRFGCSRWCFWHCFVLMLMACSSSRYVAKAMKMAMFCFAEIHLAGLDARQAQSMCW